LLSAKCLPLYLTKVPSLLDLSGNEVNLNVNGKYRINVVAHGSEMAAMLLEIRLGTLGSKAMF
jgi:hypothetical protein